MERGCLPRGERGGYRRLSGALSVEPLSDGCERSVYDGCMCAGVRR
jgi:hypothetical protein